MDLDTGGGGEGELEGGHAEEKWSVKQALLMLQHPLGTKREGDRKVFCLLLPACASPERRETGFFFF